MPKITENIQTSTALTKHSGTLSHNHTICYMEDAQQETNEKWDLKGLLQTVKFVVRGQDSLPLRKFRLTNGSRPQFSQLTSSYLAHENALSSVAKSSSVLSSHLSVMYTHSTYICTFTTLSFTRFLIYF